MRDQDKTREQLVSENEELRGRVAALQESEQRFWKYFHQDLIGMAAVTVDGRWLEFNDRLCEILGYSKDEILRKTWKELSHPDDLKMALAHFERLVSGDVDHYTIEKRYSRKDGSTVYTTIAVQAFYRADGAIDCVIGLMEDITARKQAEIALQQSHEELGIIYDGMVDGLLVTDIETLQFVRANASFCRMLGYSETELRSLSVRDIHPAEALPHILKRICSIEEANQLPAEDIPVLRKDGSVFYAEAVGKFLVYDGRPCSMGIFRDSTERKRAEEALRANEAFQRDILDNLAANIAVLDRQGTIIAVNAAWDRFAHENGAKHAAGTGVGTNYLDVCRNASGDFHDEAQVAMDGIQAVLQGHQRCFSLEYPCHSPEVQRWFMMHVTPLSCPTVGVIVAHVDITERKQTEEALERKRQSLWRMLQASDHERQIISYDIHDGLAQYLAAAEMQFQAHDSLRENSPDEARRAYETAVELVRQAHSEARRLISEVRPPVIDEIGLETAILHLVHEQRRRGGPKIECHSNVQFGRLPPILENALYRIVQEALTNACRHSKGKKVAVTMVQEGQEVRLEVQDWGIGFDPKSAGKGCFGLEGIRQRVQLLGGRLTIESTPGSGTLVQIVVPILERQND